MPLIDAGARFIVIDDSPGSIALDHPQFKVYNWGDHNRLLGENALAIPRHNGACRALGLYLAWRESDPGEAVIALDDDCVVEAADFGDSVQANLAHATRPLASGRGGHMNIFDVAAELNGQDIYPRGFPYSDRLGYSPWTFDATVTGEVHFNLGLWRGVLDINAIDRMRMESNRHPKLPLIHPTVVVPPGALVSLCAGNMQFRAEVIPALYQLPMNVEILPGQPINRIGDIWAGFILKLLMDVKGDALSVGAPLVHHEREGPFLKNAISEHIGGLVHEEMIGIMRAASSGLTPAPYLDMMEAFHDAFRQQGERSSPLLRAYFDHLNPRLEAWLRACRR